MCSVKQKHRMLHHACEPSRPHCISDSTSYILSADPISHSSQRQDHYKRSRVVQTLALTRPRAVQILKFLIGETDPPVILADDLRAPRLGKFSSGPVSTRLQDCPHAFRLMCGDDRAAGLDDPRLILCDLLQGVADHSKVVAADACKHCTYRIFHDIRGIQLAAPPRLNDLQVTFHFSKIQKCYRRLSFKNGGAVFSRRFHSGNSISYTLCQRSESLFRYPLSVYLDPLQIGNHCR